MSSLFDAVEDRARHAAKGLNHMTSTIDIPPLPIGTERRGRRLTVAVAAAAAVVIVIAVAVGVALGSGPARESGVPAFEPTPLPDGQRVSPAFRPAASYELPRTHSLVFDEPEETVVDLGTQFPLGSGDVEVLRVGAWYPGASVAGPDDLTHALAADGRLRVLQRQVTSVGGDPATRLVVKVLPHPERLSWFCTDPQQTRCMGMPSQGHLTLYLVKHDEATVLIAGGAGNDRLGAAVGRVADSMAATWQWTDR